MTKGIIDNLSESQAKSAGLLFLVHLLVALFYKEIVGISILADSSRSWEFFWQHLEFLELKNHLLKSLLLLHSQPPLYNLIVGIIVKIFDTNFLIALHWLNILLGATISAMLPTVFNTVLKSKKAALLCSTLIALHPSLFLYEAYMTYTLLSCFLVTLTCFLLAKYQKQKDKRYFFYFILIVNFLVLTRSLFHPLFLVPILAMPFHLKLKDRSQLLKGSLLISTLTVSWCLKNLLIFGFFGTSSWAGFSLWKIASFNYSKSELEQAASLATNIDEIAINVPPFSKPSRYIELGYLSKDTLNNQSQDNLNNSSIVAISKIYFKSAVALINFDRLHYLHNVYQAYLRFCRPSSQFKHLVYNNVKIVMHEFIYSNLLQAQYITKRFYNSWVSPILFALIPLSLLYWLSIFICNKSKFVNLEMQAFLTYLVGYTLFVSISFEIRENDRFKFIIEPMLWVYFLATLSSILNQLKNSSSAIDQSKIGS